MSLQREVLQKHKRLSCSNAEIRLCSSEIVYLTMWSGGFLVCSPQSVAQPPTREVLEVPPPPPPRMLLLPLLGLVLVLVTVPVPVPVLLLLLLLLVGPALHEGTFTSQGL